MLAAVWPLGQFYGHGTVKYPGSIRHPATVTASYDLDSSCQTNCHNEKWVEQYCDSWPCASDSTIGYNDILHGGCYQGHKHHFLPVSEQQRM